MDWKALALRPLSFGTGPADAVPAPFLRGQAGNRRLAALREAKEVLTVLPDPGESLHAVMTGRYDLTDLLDVIFGKLGAVKNLRVATLSFNGRNTRRIMSWIEAGTVQRLTLLFSLFYQEHNPETVEELRRAIDGKGHRLAAARSHAKVVCFDFLSGCRMVMEGSANLRTNSNREQFCLVSDPALHDYYAAYIDGEVSRHESDKSGSKTAD